MKNESLMQNLNVEHPIPLTIIIINETVSKTNHSFIKGSFNHRVHNQN